MAHPEAGLPDDFQHREGGEYELREEELGSVAIERLPSFEKASTTAEKQEGPEFGGLLPPSKEAGQKPEVVSSAAAPQQQPEEQKQ